MVIQHAHKKHVPCTIGYVFQTNMKHMIISHKKKEELFQLKLHHTLTHSNSLSHHDPSTNL